MSILVSLSPAEVARAHAVAALRNAMQRSVGRPDGKVLENSADIDIQGCLGEMAVAKALNLDWDGQFYDEAAWQRWRESGHDVSGLEVRSTRWPTGRLLLHRRDKDNAPFVLVRAEREPTFEVVGWCWARNGKNEAWWIDVGRGRPCFLVPNDLLRPMRDLLSVLPPVLV